MTDTRLWCLHHIGPDEVHPAPDFATAWRWATWANARFADAAEISRFTVAPWPWRAEQHAMSLQKSIDGWTLPAAPGANALCWFAEFGMNDDAKQVLTVRAKLVASSTPNAEAAQWYVSEAAARFVEQIRADAISRARADLDAAEEAA